jgi:K+-sensing histidine kinase KdpD
MSLYGINAFISFIVVFVVAILPILQDRKNKLYIWLSVLNLGAAFWQLDLFFLSTVDTAEAANLTSRLLRPAMLIIPFCFYNFALQLTKFKETGNLKTINRALLLSTAVSIILNIMGLGFNGCLYKPNYGYVPRIDLIYLFFMINFFSGIGTSFVIMIKKYYSRDITIVERLQLQYITLALFIVVLSAVTNILNIIGFNVLLLGTFGMFIYFILVTYAILSYDILNIRDIFQKTLMYMLTASFVAGIYLITYFYILPAVDGQGYRYSILGIVTLLITIAVGPTLNFMDKITRKALFISYYDFQVILTFVLNKLKFLKNLEDLFSETAENIRNILKLKAAAVYFWDAEKKCYLLHGQKKDEPVCIEESHPLVVYIKNKKSVIYFKRIYDDFTYNFIEKHEYGGMDIKEAIDFLKMFNAEICLPLVLNEEIKGFWIIGEKINKEALRNEEIHWLENVISQVSIMIENIFLYNQIIGSERLVMLGEMAAAVAHEIRNPLTGLSSFVQMINEGNEKKEKIIKRFFQIAPGEFKRLEKLTDNLLALSHTAKLKPVLVKLAILMEEINEFLAHVFKKNNIDLIKKI